MKIFGRTLDGKNNLYDYLKRERRVEMKKDYIILILGVLMSVNLFSGEYLAYGVKSKINLKNEMIDGNINFLLLNKDVPKDKENAEIAMNFGTNIQYVWYSDFKQWQNLFIKVDEWIETAKKNEIHDFDEKKIYTFYRDRYIYVRSDTYSIFTNRNVYFSVTNGEPELRFEKIKKGSSKNKYIDVENFEFYLSNKETLDSCFDIFSDENYNKVIKKIKDKNKEQQEKEKLFK